MNYLDVVLIAEARAKKRAIRSALRRHIHLTRDPLGIVLWQLGAEPFTAAATAWGFGPKEPQVSVPGEPRNRTLSFRALLRLAKDFNPWFESGQRPDGKTRSDLPQIVVPNRGTLTLLRRLGRRLAFLPTTGEWAADPELVRMGKHLAFLSEHARTPGQSLVVVLTDLLSTHWATELSSMEAQSLPALEAWIEPPKGMSGYDAARAAERLEIGPVPGLSEDEVMDGLLDRFNEERDRETDESIVGPLRKPIEKHYRKLVQRGWPFIWRVLKRERGLSEAASVSRRWTEDKRAIDWHLEWVVLKGGHLSTRYTHKRAAITLRRWEDAQSQLGAERALDDPLRMIASMLKNEAVVGVVVNVDEENREQGPVKLVRRPVVTLETERPCTMPIGKKLWWSGHPKGKHYVLRSAVDTPRGGSRLELCLQTSHRSVVRPAEGKEAIFSSHHVKSPFFAQWPDELPWTHVDSATATTRSVEDATEAWGGA
ncbi:MAG: hypothetical protein JKY65_01775 [Planctomycetes bacterium]|nr:hypothetical protein [Planctomycetota bacterium]